LAATADAATRTAKNNYLVAYTETVESWNPIVEVVLDSATLRLTFYGPKCEKHSTQLSVANELDLRVASIGLNSGGGDMVQGEIRRFRKDEPPYLALRALFP
jgi:hypothetical protein